MGENWGKITLRNQYKNEGKLVDTNNEGEVNNVWNKQVHNRIKS
jgi:hypothetical protein